MGWVLGLVSAAFAAALFLTFAPSVVADPWLSLPWFVRDPLLGLFVAIAAYLAGLAYPIIYHRTEEMMADV